MAKSKKLTIITDSGKVTTLHFKSRKHAVIMRELIGMRGLYGRSAICISNLGIVTHTHLPQPTCSDTRRISNIVRVLDLPNCGTVPTPSDIAAAASSDMPVINNYDRAGSGFNHDESMSQEDLMALSSMFAVVVALSNDHVDHTLSCDTFSVDSIDTDVTASRDAIIASLLTVPPVTGPLGGDHISLITNRVVDMINSGPISLKDAMTSTSPISAAAAIIANVIKLLHYRNDVSSVAKLVGLCTAMDIGMRAGTLIYPSVTKEEAKELETAFDRMTIPTLANLVFK